MAEYRFAENVQSLDFYFLIAKHIDRMSESLVGGLNPGGAPNSEKLIAYYMQTKHYENMVTMFLPKYYWDRKAEIMPEIPDISWTWKDVVRNLEFFDKVSQWFQILHLTSYNEGVLKIKRPYKVDEAGKVFKDGFKPNFGDL